MRNLLLLVLLLLIAAAFSTPQDNRYTKDDFVVAAYLPDYRFYINVNATAPFLTDLILFSIEANKYGLVNNVCCLDAASHYQIAREARAYKREVTKSELKLWLSVGGAGRSSGFAQIAQDPKKRSRYLNSLRDLCLKEELDGIDFDWEQPSSQQEYQAYMVLLLEASQVMHDAGLLVSVATRQLPIPEKVAQTLDRIHLMAYNLAYPPKYHADFALVTRLVEQHESNSHKLVLGIPAYAQHVETGQFDKTFSEVMDQVLQLEKDTLNDDMTNQFDGYRFDSPLEVKRKVAYAKSKHLRGVFLWELGQDKQLEGVAQGGILLEAANKKAVGSVDKSASEQEL